MCVPTREEFFKLAERGNLVPIYRELSADLETPVSVYLKLRDHAESFLLESVEGGEQLARYSFIGINPSRVLTVRGSQVTIRNHKSTDSFSLNGRDPLDALRVPGGVRILRVHRRVEALDGLERAFLE